MTPKTPSPRPPATYARSCAPPDGNLSQALLGYNHSPRLRPRGPRARPGVRAPAAMSSSAPRLGEPTDTIGCAGSAFDLADRPGQPARRRARRRATRLPLAACLRGHRPASQPAERDRRPPLRRRHVDPAALPPARQRRPRSRPSSPTATAPPSTSSRPTGPHAGGLGRPPPDALAHDLGWTPACARSGTRPACQLAPAIQFIGYDGYPDHGSPRTCTGGCPPHLHVSWASPCYGTSRLSAPCAWVMAFAVLPADYGEPPAMSDWAPLRARRLGHEWRAQRYFAGHGRT